MQSLASRWDQHHRCALQLIPEGKKGGRNLELLIKLVKKIYKYSRRSNTVGINRLMLKKRVCCSKNSYS